MDLAKAHLDLGLFTNNKDEMLQFWQEEIGLPFDHLGKLGGGVHQLRHFLGGGPEGPILKINHARDVLADANPSGYHELFLVRDTVKAPKSLVDPDGNKVTLIPNGYKGITTSGIKIKAANLSASMQFYSQTLNLLPCAEAGPGAFKCGESILILEEDKSLIPHQPYQAKGFRYLTVQIFSADKEHRHIIGNGGTEGRPPRTLGTTVRYSFVKDPDGNWIELSQRATLTGSLEKTE
ncbi:MAG: VOC family protein, partial [Sneathiella sp.]